MANIVFKPNHQNYSITNLRREAKQSGFSLIKEIQRKLHNFFYLESISFESDTVDELCAIIELVDTLVEKGRVI